MLRICLPKSWHTARPRRPIEPVGFGRVADRIARRTTGGLATAVLLIGGLLVGRETAAWRHEEAEQSSSTSPTDDRARQEAEQAGVVQFLVPNKALRCFSATSWRGDAPSALTELRRRCREAMAMTTVPAASLGPAESRLLAATNDLVPIEETPAGRLYDVPDALPMVVGIRSFAEASPHEATAGSTSRIVAWGFAMRQADDDWTLLLLTRSELSETALYGSFGEKN